MTAANTNTKPQEVKINSFVDVKKPANGSSNQIIFIKTTLLVLFIGAIIFVFVFFPVKDIILDSTSKLRDQGVIKGGAYFVLVFWIQILFGIPSTFCEALSGFIFGFWYSIIITTIGKNGGSMLAFQVGRMLGKETVGSYLEKRFPTFRAMKLAFKKSGWEFLFLFQLGYFPIFLKCFGLSIMDISSYRFFISSLVCGFPYTLFWSYLGSQSNNIMKVVSGGEKIGVGKIAIASLGILAGIIAMIFLGKYTRAQLQLLQIDCTTTKVIAVDGVNKANADPLSDTTGKTGSAVIGN